MTGENISYESYISIIKPILLDFYTHSDFLIDSSNSIKPTDYFTKKLNNRIRLKTWLITNYLNPVYPNITDNHRNIIKHLYFFLDHDIEFKKIKLLNYQQTMAYKSDVQFLPLFLLNSQNTEKGEAYDLSLLYNQIESLEKNKSINDSNWKLFVRTIKNTFSFFLFIVRYPIIRLNKYFFREKFIEKLLKNKRFHGVWDAIDTVSDVLNYFVFKKGIRESLKRKSSLSELTCLVIQLGDEFIDQISIQIGIDKTIEIIKTNNSIFSIFLNQETNSFFVTINLDDLVSWGVNIDAINDKYKITYKELYQTLSELLNEINIKIQKSHNPKETSERVNLCFWHCLSTYYDDLAINQIDNNIKYFYSHTKWYYYKKTNGVMIVWLILRSSLFKLDPIKFKEKIFEWGHLLYNFQIFDDLKDMQVDFGFQPNIAHIIAFQNFPNEFEWFKNNINEFGENITIDEIVKLSLEMPLTVSNILLISKYEAIKNHKWFTLFLISYRWKRNWTDSFLNFYNPKNSFNLLTHSSISFFNKIVNTESTTINVVFSCLLKTQTAYKGFKNKSYYFDYLLGLCLYDSGFRVHFHFTNDPIKSYYIIGRFHFMRIGHKEKILNAFIRAKRKHALKAFENCAYLIENDELKQYIIKNWLNE